MCNVIVSSCVIILIMVILWALIIYVKYIEAQRRLDEIRRSYQSLEIKLKDSDNLAKEKSIEYSNKLMEYLREFIAQIVVLRFKAFQDGHDMTKITEANIKNLVNDVATEVKASINELNILFDNMLITREFYDKYIVETVIFNIKKMIDKYQEDNQ